MFPLWAAVLFSILVPVIMFMEPFLSIHCIKLSPIEFAAEGHESEFAEGKGQHPKEQKDSEAFHHSCGISFRCL